MKTIIKFSLAILTAASFCACSSADKNEIIEPKEDENNAQNNEAVQGENGTLEILSEPEYISTMSFEGNDNAINEGINKFSFDFFNKVAQNPQETIDGEDQLESENITLSPLGAAICLGLQANALDDSGTAQLVKMFGASSLNEYNTYCQKLMRFLPYSGNNSSELILANSAWLSNKYLFNETFSTSLKNYFNAEVYNVDFSNSEIQGIMDLWCSKKTKGTINKSPINVSDSLIYTLMNAMYFNANWHNKFSADDTSDEDFYGTSGTKSISMMHNKIYAKYSATDDFKAIEIPYQNTNYDMVVVLPNDGVDIVELSKSFNVEDLEKALDGSTYEVNLSLPKFKIEQNLSLLSVLYKLGYPSSAMMTKAGIDRSVTTQVKQNTFTTVNEDGTIVAAITALVAITLNGSTPNYPTVNVNVNHPFLFFVRNNVTGSILMAGRVCNIM